MNCRQARRLLTAAQVPSAGLRGHLDDCAGCAAYRERHEAVLRALGAHHTAVAPPNDFATRLRARLERNDDPIGWAALRLLPASLILVLLLSWLNLRLAAEETQALADPTTAVLSWALESGAPSPEDGR